MSPEPRAATAQRLYNPGLEPTPKPKPMPEDLRILASLAHPDDESSGGRAPEADLLEGLR